MNIRRAASGDRAAVLELVRRISASSTPAHRSPDETLAADLRAVGESLDTDGDDVAVLVAEDDGRVTGFIHLQSHVDYYSGRMIGHVADLAVAPDAEGKGIARALMAAAEEWARERAYPWLDLNVGPGNERARLLYERLGFGVEWTRYVKRLA